MGYKNKRRAAEKSAKMSTLLPWIEFHSSLVYRLGEDKGRIKVCRALRLSWHQQKEREREGGRGKEDFGGNLNTNLFASLALTIARRTSLCCATALSTFFFCMCVIITPLLLSLFTPRQRRDVPWKEVTPQLNILTLEGLEARLISSRRVWEWRTFGETFTHWAEWRTNRYLKFLSYLRCYCLLRHWQRDVLSRLVVTESLERSFLNSCNSELNLISACVFLSFFQKFCHRKKKTSCLQLTQDPHFHGVSFTPRGFSINVCWK